MSIKSITFFEIILYVNIIYTFFYLILKSYIISYIVIYSDKHTVLTIVMPLNSFLSLREGHKVYPKMKIVIIDSPSCHFEHV